MIRRLLSSHCTISQQAIGLLFGMFSYFLPIRNVILLLLSMILVDLFSGIWAAYKAQQPISSQKMWKTVPKIVWACLAVMLAFGMEQELQLEWLGLTKVVGGVICGFEFWSILEHAAMITEHPVFGFIKKLLQRKAERALEQEIVHEQ